MNAGQSRLAQLLQALLDAHEAQQLLGRLAAADATQQTDVLHAMVEAAEARVWQGGQQPGPAHDLQQLFHEIEAQLHRLGLPRHHIHVVIPVADRPRHLQSCLDSLKAAVEAFGYGGRISVVVADDSLQPHNLQAQREIVRQAASDRIETLYFGHAEQSALLDGLSPAQRNQLRNLIGEPTPQRMGHKGASVMRNIAYLLLARLAGERARPLFHFVDSDQEFHVDTRDGEPVYALNHFYHLDRLFRERDIEVLTGKVVGDPPVSPAVMAGTLLQDLQAFLVQVAAGEPDAPCPFHADGTAGDGALYHDMPGLFGFTPVADACAYRCRRTDAHTLADAALDFARSLERFFDGEHPTRSTAFSAGAIDASMAPARTVYTGNYVLTATGLRHCLPFAAQRLRMAGPTLGRLLQAQLGGRFVSANLPMLHRRTQREAGCSEYRPGVQRAGERVDLSGEYQRQFLGDLVLFSVAALLQQGYLERVHREAIERQLHITTEDLGGRYRQVRDRLQRQLDQVERQLQAQAACLAGDPRLAETAALVARFLEAIRHNHGDKAAAVARIDSGELLREHLPQLLEMLSGYAQDQDAWLQVLQRVVLGPSADPPLP